MNSVPSDGAQGCVRLTFQEADNAFDSRITRRLTLHKIQQSVNVTMKIIHVLG